MFPLAGKSFPESTDELASAIETALSEVFSFPDKKSTVTVTAAKFPTIQSVTINLDDAYVSATKPPAKPLPVAGRREGNITVDQMQVSGQPIYYQNTKLDLKLSGSGLKFEFGRDKNERPLLVLTDANDGQVEAQVSKQDIQTLLLALASTAAAEQGVTIQDLQLDLESDGPRAVAAHVRVKAKKMIMSGIIIITARLDVDDELIATISDLACKGEGMIGTAAAGVLQKKIQPFDGTHISLMAFSLGDVKLRDLKIVIKDAVQVSAAFGNGNKS